MGELPVITRKRRPKPVLPSVIIPEEPKGKLFYWVSEIENCLTKY